VGNGILEGKSSQGLEKLLGFQENFRGTNSFHNVIDGGKGNHKPGERFTGESKRIFITRETGSK